MAKQVIELFALDKDFEPVQVEASLKNISDEVGDELAVMLQTARQNGGKLVCEFPIYKFGSFRRQVADISEFEDLIISPLDFCSVLHSEAKIDSDVYSNACIFIKSLGQTEQKLVNPSIFDFPIYINRNTLILLHDARLLQPIARSGCKIIFHPDVFVEMNSLIGEEQISDQLVSDIENIRAILLGALESDNVSFLPFARDSNNQIPTNKFWLHGIRSLLESSDLCDAICIDDRMVNKYPSYTDSLGQLHPIVCVLDIIRYLVSQECISDENQWTMRHKLRNGGYAFVPPEPEELRHWLTNSISADGTFKASSELRVLHQTTARIGAIHFPNSVEMFELTESFRKSCRQTISELWEVADRPPEQLKTLSNWVWNLQNGICFLGTSTF